MDGPESTTLISVSAILCVLSCWWEGLQLTQSRLETEGAVSSVAISDCVWLDACWTEKVNEIESQASKSGREVKPSPRYLNRPLG